jgi:hypothetical protein
MIFGVRLENVFLLLFRKDCILITPDKFLPTPFQYPGIEC